ncbi:MAG: ABC transporter substrate-binding protein, partial [Candidatus Thorarchaeota archaeon]
DLVIAYKKINSALLVSSLLMLFMFTILATINVQAPANQYFFRVRILSRSDTPASNLANLLVQDLNKIRIDSQLVTQPEGAFESALISRQFDVVFVDLDWPTDDVNPLVYFSENGAANYWGIDDSISGGALNEELLQEALTTTNFVARRDVYFEWQENLMANILPIIPLYNKVTSFASWDSITGWDHQEGIVASLPYMEWTTSHYGQENTSEYVDYIDSWEVLNPLFTDEDFIINLIFEPLIRIDSNQDPTGILASSWFYNSNQTELTVDLRKDVLWQPDIDNIYTGEKLNADDVIFSILMYQELSTTGSFFGWIKSMEKYNSTRVILTIDGDSNSPGLQPYAPALAELVKPIIPEHYLNISVGENGLPDTSHPNWANFGEYGLGTGMYIFQPELFNDGIEAVLYYNKDWWGSTPEGLNEDLDFKAYVLRFLYDQTTKQLEFEGGRLDLFRDYRETYEEYSSSPYTLQTKSEYDISYLGFNLKSLECIQIHDDTLTEDATMSKGLAVRKAIAHLIDKANLENMLDIEIQTIDTPFSNRFSDFIKSDVTKYSFDVELAKEYMLKAGYDPNTLPSPGFSFEITISSILITTSLIFIMSRKKNLK